MTDKSIKLNPICILIFFFVFSVFFEDLLLAGDVLAKRKASTHIESKIEDVEGIIDTERYKVRLEEAKEYLRRGDNYYAEGKLLEALGEWYAALALVELLRDVEIDSIRDVRILLEEKVKSRLEADKAKPIVKDRQRIKAIQQEVKRILAEQEREARLTKIKVEKEEEVKEKISEQEREIKEKPAKAREKAKEEILGREERLSLEELEAMKKAREAVEAKISQDFVRVKEEKELEAAEEIAKRAEEEERLAQEKNEQGEKERQESLERKRQAREKRLEQRQLAKEARIQKAKERAEQRRKERQEKLEARRVQRQEKERKRKEALLAREDDSFRRNMENAISQGLSIQKREQAKLRKEIEKTEKRVFRQHRKEEDKDKVFKDKRETVLQKKIDTEAKQRKDLKAKTEKEEKNRLQALQKTRQEDIDAQLKVLEKEQAKTIKLKETEKKEAARGEKLLRRKEEKAARKREKERIEKVKKPTKPIQKSVSSGRRLLDRFDIIDRTLRRLEGNNWD